MYLKTFGPNIIKHQVFFRSESVLMEIPPMLVVTRAQLHHFSTIQCSSKSKMYGSITTQCSRSDNFTILKIATSPMLTYLVHSLTTMTTQDSWAKQTIGLHLNLQSLSLWHPVEFHSSTMEMSKALTEVVILHAENPYGMWWIQMLKSINMLQRSTKRGRLLKYGIFHTLNAMLPITFLLFRKVICL